MFFRDDTGIVQQTRSPRLRDYPTRIQIESEDVAACEELVGVSTCHKAGRYRLQVWRGEAFSWDEVGPRVLALLEVKRGE